LVAGPGLSGAGRGPRPAVPGGAGAAAGPPGPARPGPPVRRARGVPPAPGRPADADPAAGTGPAGRGAPGEPTAEARPHRPRRGAGTDGPSAEMSCLDADIWVALSRTDPRAKRERPGRAGHSKRLTPAHGWLVTPWATHDGRAPDRPAKVIEERF